MNEEYINYINSSEWKEKRGRIIDERGQRCEKCGCEKPISELNLHYKNYDMEYGKESDEDLLLICVDCHKELHQDLEFFDNVETVGLCPQCSRPMRIEKKKMICDFCHIKLEPKIK